MLKDHEKPHVGRHGRKKGSSPGASEPPGPPGTKGPQWILGPPGPLQPLAPQSLRTLGNSLYRLNFRI